MSPPVAIPEGVLTLMGGAAQRQRAAEQRCLDILTNEGFQLVLLPVLEFEQEAPGTGYRFVDRSGQVVALRTDFTPLAVRMLAPTLEHAELPLGVCYAGEVVRPRPASLRQLPELYQLGFERYGVADDGLAALRLVLQLLESVAVDPAYCHVTVSRAGLAERILSGLLGTPANEAMVELMRARDIDALADVPGLAGPAFEALAEALLDGVDGDWPVVLDVVDEVESLRPLVETAADWGAAASVDIAPRLSGSYYEGAVFTVWGRGTRATLASGGEYRVELRERRLEAGGACVALGVALEEGAC